MRRRERVLSLLLALCLCVPFVSAAVPAGAVPAMTELRLTNDLVKQNKAQVWGDVVVYRSLVGTCSGNDSGNWDVWMYNLTTHQASAVCTETHLQNHPTVRGNIIAWMDKRDDPEGDIWMYDITTGKQSAVCTAAGEQCNLAIGDGFITWVDWRDSATNGADIYMKDLATGVESAVATGTGNQQCVGAGDHTIVWRDNSVYPNKVWLYDVPSGETTLVADGKGSIDDPRVSEDGRFVAFSDNSDIYMWDRDTRAVSEVCTATDGQYGVAISGDRIVWEDRRSGNSNVYMYDISEATESVIASAPGCQGSPDISGDTIVWNDERWGLKDSNDTSLPEIMALRLTDTPKSTVPVEGTTRYLTAIAASKEAFPLGSDTVVIATGENWPDALGGAAFAGAYHAPILLTSPGSLSGSVELELLRLGAKNAIVLGSEKAVAKAVTDRLDTILPGTVTRIGGATRYDTANLVAQATVARLGDAYDGKAFVTTGDNYPDALAASPLAYKAGIPLFLAGSTGPSATTLGVMASLDVTQSVYLGRDTVTPFPAGIVEGDDVVRLGGATRYETAVLVAGWGVENLGMNWYNLHLATGDNFPDALSGSAVAGSWSTVLLLTPSHALNGSTGAAITANKADIERVIYLGSTSAIDAGVRTSVANLLD